MSNFPVLDGIAALTLLVDNDERGAGERASEICDIRWLAAGARSIAHHARRRQHRFQRSREAMSDNRMIELVETGPRRRPRR